MARRGRASFRQNENPGPSTSAPGILVVVTGNFLHEHHDPAPQGGIINSHERPAFGAVGGGLKLAGCLIWTVGLIRGRHWPVVKPIFRAVHYRPMIPAVKSDALNRPARSLSTEEARIAAKSASSSQQCTMQIVGGVWLAEVSGICSLSAGCSHLAWRLSGPAFACMRERAHLMKTEQPRNLGYMQLAVIEVTNRQIAPQLLKYFREVQPFVRKPSCKRPLAHSQTASNVFH